jgi:hypothetical protein
MDYSETKRTVTQMAHDCVEGYRRYAPETAQYIYYKRGAPGKQGGLLISPELPAGYELAQAERIDPSESYATIERKIRQLAMTLPILAY